MGKPETAAALGVEDWVDACVEAVRRHVNGEPLSLDKGAAPVVGPRALNEGRQQPALAETRVYPGPRVADFNPEMEALLEQQRRQMEYDRAKEEYLRQQAMDAYQNQYRQLWGTVTTAGTGKDDQSIWQRMFRDV